MAAWNSLLANKWMVERRSNGCKEQKEGNKDEIHKQTNKDLVVVHPRHTGSWFKIAHRIGIGKYSLWGEHKTKRGMA